MYNYRNPVFDHLFFLLKHRFRPLAWKLSVRPCIQLRFLPRVYLLHSPFRSAGEKWVYNQLTLPMLKNFDCPLFAILNPAEAVFSPKHKEAKILKTISSLSCWYPLEISRWVLSDEYRLPGFQPFFQGSLHHLPLAKVATSSIRVTLTDDSINRLILD